MPEQSAAKAREILAQLIDALGGPSYTEVRERECDWTPGEFWPRRRAGRLYRIQGLLALPG